MNYRTAREILEGVYGSDYEKAPAGYNPQLGNVGGAKRRIGSILNRDPIYGLRPFIPYQKTPKGQGGLGVVIPAGLHWGAGPGEKGGRPRWGNRQPGRHPDYVRDVWAPLGESKNMNYGTAREILAEARMKYAQDAIPLRPELYMLTYSTKDPSGDGPRKFIGRMRKNPKQLERISEGAYKGAMEDWLTDLPKPAIAELKAKHGKELAHTGGEGYRDIATKKTLPLHKSIVGILKKHKVKPFAHNINDSSHVIQMSFHTYHGDMNEEKQEGGDESKESTKSMIARLVARGHKKLGKKIPDDVIRDVDPKYKTKDDMYEANDAIDKLPPNDNQFWQGARNRRPSDGRPNLFWRKKLNPGNEIDALEPRGSDEIRRIERERQLRDRLQSTSNNNTTVAEAVSDIGQNLKGMPRKAARKLAYASRDWGKGKIGNKEYEVAAARHTRRMGSNAKRWGKKLEKSLSDFSARTGIKLK